MRGVALATGIVLALSAPLVWLIERSILPEIGAGYLAPLVLTLVVVVLAQVAVIALRRCVHEASPLPAPLLPLAVAASAMFALVSLDVAGSSTLAEATWLGLGAALVMPMLLVAFASMLDRLRAADVPHALRGAPIALITAGLMALALMGLAGLGAR